MKTGGLAGLILVLGAVWWAIADGAPRGWTFGAPAVILAAYVLARTGPLRWPLFSPMGAMRFAAFFVWESLIGGIDVAARVLRPALGIEPAIQRYKWRLPPGGLRVLAIATVSLQPGTLAVRDQHETVEIHVLNRSLDLAGSMARLESLIAAMAGVELRSVGTDQ